MTNEKLCSKPHLFISGVFRSGTTFLARALNSHPKLTVLSDPHREFFKHLRNKFYKKHVNDFDSNQPLSDYFLENNRLKNQFHEEMFDLNIDNEELKEVKRKIIKRSYPFSPLISNNIDELNPGKAFYVYKQLLELGDRAYFKDSSQMNGTKEVWTDEFIGNLLKMGSKCVQVIRDPRAIISSNRKSETGAYPILFLIRQWRKSVAYYLENKDKPGCLMLKYEDLVTNPEKEFRKILEFLGIEFHENVLDPSTYKDGYGNQWKQNSSHGTSESINTSYMEKWKEVLDEKELNIIEWFCKPEMDFMNYRPVLPKNKFPEEEDLWEEQYDYIADWIKQYDYFLNKNALMKEKSRYEYLFSDESLSKDEVEQYFINVCAYEGLKQALKLQNY